VNDIATGFRRGEDPGDETGSLHDVEAPKGPPKGAKTKLSQRWRGWWNVSLAVKATNFHGAQRFF